MRRGAIWTVAGGGGYAGKPRPVVIVQADAFSETDSLTIAPLTTVLLDAPLQRIVVEPAEANGLHATSAVMIDKITTVSKTKFGHRIGHLDDRDMRRLERALLVFLGIA